MILLYRPKIHISLCFDKKNQHSSNKVRRFHVIISKTRSNVFKMDQSLKIGIENPENHELDHQLKDFWKQWALDSEEREKIDVEEMVDRMRTMADKLPEENGQIFEEVFVGFLELITLSKQPPTGFQGHFKDLTGMMCEFCVESELRPKFIDHWFTQWQQCLNHLSKHSKYTILLELVANYSSRVHSSSSSLERHIYVDQYISISERICVI